MFGKKVTPTGGMSESGVQSVLHAMELGAWAKYIKGGFFALASLALVVWYVALQFRGFELPEAMDQAQLARNISSGEGFTTKFIRPASAWKLHQLRGDAHLKQAHPDLFNPPLFPYTVATVFKLASPPFEVKAPPIGAAYTKYPPENPWIVATCEFFFLASAVLVYFMASRLFDKRIALISASIFLLLDILHRYSISGLPTTLLMFLFLCVQMCLVQAHLLAEQEEKKYQLWLLSAIAGLLCGLCVLTKYTAAWLILPVFCYIGLALGKQRWVCLSLAVALLLVVVTPWMVRNNAISGRLFGFASYALLEQSPKYPGDQLYRAFKDVEELQTKQVLRKTFNGLRDFVAAPWQKSGTGLITAFFIAGLLFRYKKEQTLAYRRFVLYSAVLAGIASSFGGATSLSRDSLTAPSNVVVILAPGIVMFGTAFFFLLFDRVKIDIPLFKHAAVVCLIVLCAVPFLSSQISARGRPPYRYPSPPYWEPSIAWVAKWFNPDEIIVSDMPWAVAWYGNGRSLWLPNTMEEFYQINDYHARLPGLYVTLISQDRRLFTELRTPDMASWAPIILSGQLPKGFPLVAGIRVPGFLSGELLLADRARWSEEKSNPSAQSKPSQ